jgi:hypothetical protein
VTLTGGYTQWKGNEVGVFSHRKLERNPRVWFYGLEFTPMPLFTASITQQRTERGQTEARFGLSFTYPFDLSPGKQPKPSRGTGTVSGDRYEFVNRENRIILEYRDKKVDQASPTPVKHGPVVELSGGGAFVDINPGEHYQSVVTMTVKRYDNGVEDPSWSPSGPVTWTVEASTVNLSSAVWNRAADAKNGLMWVASATTPVDGTTNWSANTIQGTPLTAATAYLADVVGSRTIRVKATLDNADGGGEAISEEFPFQDGPLSVFTRYTGSMVWATANGSSAFPALNNSEGSNFPPATFCGGSVKNNVVGGSRSGSDAGFTPNDGGWDADALPYPTSPYAGRYANTSGMATGEQLLAVATYDSNRNDSGKAAGRKGAYLAAGWTISQVWTGEVSFDNTSATPVFVPAEIYLTNGAGYWTGMDNPTPVVCR